RMAVKSEIIRPTPNSALQPGVNRISGIAWAGEEAVAGGGGGVDRGRAWGQAALVGAPATYSRGFWEYLLGGRRPPEYTLMCRATSADGETQPAQHDPLHGGYRINFVRPHRIGIVGAGKATESWGDTLSRLDVMSHQAQESANKRLDVDLNSEFTDGG